MEDIVKSFSGPWMIIRDLNCISSSEDKMGGGGGFRVLVLFLQEFSETLCLIQGP
jgi:hypothetical protein